jgi:CRISPR-associated protein Csb2
MELLGRDEDSPEPNWGPVEEVGFSGDPPPARVLCPAEAMTQADLERTTSALQHEGWNDPPGTRWVLYQRVGETVAPEVRTPVRQPQAHRPVVAEFSLGAAVLPLFTEAVLVAQQIRAAALSRHGDPSEVLAGKDREGNPLQEQHRHAHYIPDARGSGKRVSHVLVYAPMGFSESEQAALAKVSFLRQRHNRPIVHVVLAGFGSLDDLRGATPLFGASRRWRSRTPFVLTRHPRRGKDTPADQVMRECRARGLAEPLEVRSIPGVRLFDRMAGESGVTRWVEFVTARQGRRHPLGAYGFELVFSEPVQGPLLLGYGCHYGLGQFEAIA